MKEQPPCRQISDVDDKHARTTVMDIVLMAVLLTLNRSLVSG